jgi:hypothetical protein
LGRRQWIAARFYIAMRPPTDSAAKISKKMSAARLTTNETARGIDSWGHRQEIMAAGPTRVRKGNIEGGQCRSKVVAAQGVGQYDGDVLTIHSPPLRSYDEPDE